MIHMPCDDGLLHGGHADQIRPKCAKGANLRRCLKARSQQSEVNAFVESETLFLCRMLRQRAKAPRISLRHVEEAWAKALVVGSGDRIAAGEIDVIGKQDELALCVRLANSTGGIREDQSVNSTAGQCSDGKRDLLRRVALIGMKHGPA